MAIRIYGEFPSSTFDALQIDFTERLLPAYGWLFPIDHKRANVGIGIDVDNYKKHSMHIEKLLSLYQKDLGSHISYDDNSALTYILPYGSELPRLAYPESNAALIGDAGSMINPLTGEGIFYGMYAGHVLGQLLAAELRSNPRLVRVARQGYGAEFLQRQILK